MHRYLVRYISRDGHFAKTTVLAKSKGEARRCAADLGCEDIFKVRRIGLPYTPVVLLALIVVSALFLILK